jgi:hypothetical protein
MSNAVILVHDHPQRDTFPQQTQFFEANILPMVQKMPGFVSGLWGYDTTSSRTHSYVVFDSEPAAQRLVDHLRNEAGQPNPFGIQLVSCTLARHLYSRP